MASQLERCEREWHELEGEFQELQDTHRIYRQKLEELTTLQTSCSSSINKQKTRLKDLKHTLQRYKRHASREEAELVQQLGASIKERQNIFFDMEAYLPKKNGIKGWWVSHHYVSTFLSGVMLTWPNGLIYQKFRNQFLAFSIFQSCVQFLQYYYQRGCLYRLRALGERNHLDLTVEGFQSWMWRGLTFLLPFLFCGHFWQLYNAITLFELSSHEECREWQGPAVQSLLQLGPGRPWEGIRKTREPLSGLRNPRRFALGGGPREEPPRTLPDPLGLTPFIQLAQISAFCWQTLQFAGSLCQGGSEVPGGRGGHFSKES
ncbi:transmembrane protein 120B isoform X6 [Eubalaena glacialis]|uniref:transmembrane protein 120B isoform X6 n=1 Tax=Eubalaena glacialis TaxID=27606 RepID=UPI002A5A9AB2|nr:transmembrane protein 120B isoform X6 [Eubalaena glacialis]